MDTSIAPRHFRAPPVRRAARMTGILLLVVLAGALCRALRVLRRAHLPGRGRLGGGDRRAEPPAGPRPARGGAGRGRPSRGAPCGGEEWILSAAELGGRLALEEGRRRGLGARAERRLSPRPRRPPRALWYGYRVVPRVTIEPGRRCGACAGWRCRPARPARQATAGGGLQARRRAETGHDLHITATRLAIKEAVAERLGRAAGTGPRWARWWRHTGPGRTSPSPCGPSCSARWPVAHRGLRCGGQATLILSTPITLTATLEEFDDQGRPRPVERRWLDRPAHPLGMAGLERRAVGDEATLAVTVDRERIAAYAGRSPPPWRALPAGRLRTTRPPRPSPPSPGAERHHRRRRGARQRVAAACYTQATGRWRCSADRVAAGHPAATSRHSCPSA